MKRILISQIKRSVGKSVKIAGFVESIRDQGSIAFSLVRDISGKIQLVVSKEKPELLKIVKGLTIESVVEITGLVKEEKQAPGGLEIAPDEIKVLSLSEPELPIPVVEKGEDTELQKRLDYRWLDLRKPKKQLIFKVWTTMEQAFREHLIKEGYLEIHSPKFMGNASESGSELFEVKYFDKKAYLAQSPQFYKQMAMAAGFEKVFEVGPVFRANPSFTSRHDTEFTMYDMEISYIDSHQEVIHEEEKFIVAMVKAVKQKFGSEIEKEYDRKLVIPVIPFPQLTMAGAKRILAEMKIPGESEGDLNPEEERKICEYTKKNTGHEFLFVIDYPASCRPFYHMRYEDKPRVTKSFDLLWNGLEITTGAQREHRYKQLYRQAREMGLSPEKMPDYFNYFRYGCPPHGGCAPGPTRMLMKIFNISNVREVTYLYRGVNRLTP